MGRKTTKLETFYAKGQLGRNTPIDVALHDGRIVASAERNQITLHQLKTALQKEYPDYSWSTSTHGQKYLTYWITHGRRK